ncbi:hypothetical protein MP228_010897 [Amoeboaphelidium protococcarum]|nr:hypothetical protein MP228_010897 [Amoeboaphelidium protococcarum]
MVAQENNYEAVAVAGASGNLGSYFTDELLKNEFSVTVLVSESSKNDPLKSKRYSDWEQKGAKVVVVDYQNVESLESALKGIAVVVSALSGPGLQWQQYLVKAAKKANVKRVIPSEYGIDTEAHQKQIPLLASKPQLVNTIKELGLEYTVFYTGMFIDTTFWDWFSWHPFEHKATIVGKGDTKCSFTMRSDIAKAVVQSLLHPEKYKNKTVHLVGDQMTLNEVVTIFEKASLKKWDVDNKSVAEAETEIKNAADKLSVFPQYLQLAIENGWAQLSNNQLPQLVSNPISIEEFAKQLYALKK